MTRFGSVYVVTHSASGGQYVGQTRQKTVQKRWYAHWRSSQCATARKSKFLYFLAREGPEAFTVAEVFVAFDAKALNDAEIAVIADLQPTYNSSRGGKGLRPFTCYL